MSASSEKVNSVGYLLGQWTKCFPLILARARLPFPPCITQTSRELCLALAFVDQFALSFGCAPFLSSERFRITLIPLITLGSLASGLKNQAPLLADEHLFVTFDWAHILPRGRLRRYTGRLDDEV